jgi:hypothetical protein
MVNREILSLFALGQQYIPRIQGPGITTKESALTSQGTLLPIP